MRGTVQALAMVLGAGALGLGGCGDQTRSGPTSSTAVDRPAAVHRERVDPGRLRALELRPGRSSDLADACRELAGVVGTDLCPRVEPRGTPRVTWSGRLRGWGATFGIDLSSAALGHHAGGRIATAGGHWTVEATTTQRAQRLFHLQMFPTSASRRSRCSHERAGGRPVLVCEVAPHSEGGGYYAGHVVAQWVQGAVGLQVSAHGYRNRARVIAMLGSALPAR